MIYLLFSCVVLIISIILFILRHKINKKIDQQNIELEKKNEYLLKEIDSFITIREDLKIKNLTYEAQTKANQEKLETVQNLLEQEQEQAKQIQGMFDKNKEIAFKAFESWWENLEHSYSEKAQEYDNNLRELQLSSDKERALIEQDLNKIRQTRAAAIEALKREQEIKDKLSFYCLQITPIELADIKNLEGIKPQLNNPRILSMLIWSTYFQKPMTTLCNNVIGTTVKSGIYKITNQTNNICYIGQAVDLATRWKSHAKCGLGIDTPANNPLYKAMIADGIWNFSFEVLEECSREELNEKEKYYIQLYQSKDFGYNSTAGNK